MKHIIFKQISIRNFLSIGNEPIVINFRSGLNIITGTNKDKDDSRNGVGKSAIAESIYFAVFGSTLRDIKKENIGNDSFKGSCEIILDLDVISSCETTCVNITRTLDPSKVLLTINGMDKTLDSIANTNESITQLLNCSAEVFENCVIMTLNNALPFMSKKKQDKRKFIESIFNLEIFSKMLLNVKTDYSDYKNQLDVIISKKDQIYSTIQSLEAQEKRTLAERRDKIIAQQNKISAAIKRKTDLTTKQNELDLSALATEKTKKETTLKSIDPIRLQLKASHEALLKSKAAIESKITENRIKIAEHNSIINNTKTNIGKINSSEPTCPVCLRAITADDITHIETEKQKLQVIINDNKNAIDLLNNVRTDLNSQCAVENTNISNIISKQDKLNTLESEISTAIRKINSAEQEGAKLQQNIDFCTTEINGLQEHLEELQSNTTTFSNSIEEQKQKQEGIQKQIDIFKQKISLLDKVKFVFSEEGVKSFLVKQILDLFNNRMGHYLQKMDANCACLFNEYFEETVINDKGKQCSYYNFSGAERKKVDLACLFAFMDIRRLQGDVSMNISLYDELLDSSLDAKGIELVTNILLEHVEKYKECVYVISHRKESIKLATGDVVYLQKNNGVTTRVEFNQSFI